ncbi:tetratricopeptide repeat protein [Sphingobacterium alkalisoli]|uniref:Tetratricopeptide repeat protein n=1 Tax=Sphingobacterium alkalisoli TaxID=1874115 RepID=A0A4U0H516_9SPHI|nr:tetratricopeptide repeat protein [Sphingobacterium alkalisoli]TJY66708.1 tetratricopeptide repeat protein [Sphingobacterium alkalisoli]
MKINFYLTCILLMLITSVSCNLPDVISMKYYYHSGNHKHGTKDFKGAIQDFSKIIEISNKEINAYISRGSCYLDLKAYQKAVDDYSAAIELEPENPLAYAYRGRAYYDCDSIELSLADYNKALQIDPKSVYAYNNRGLLRFTNKDLPGGCQDYKIAADLGDEESVEMVRTYCAEFLREEK